jgi:hypothetical protein
MTAPLRHRQGIIGSAAASIPTSATISPSVALRIRHLARHLHSLGERPLYEWACEVVGGADPLARLEAYGRLDVDTVRALGADKLPPSLTVIRGRSLAPREQFNLRH